MPGSLASSEAEVAVDENELVDSSDSRRKVLRFCTDMVLMLIKVC